MEDDKSISGADREVLRAKVALGVPVTDIEEVKVLAYHDKIAGFDDEVGMIHSIAHDFEHFGIKERTVGRGTPA